MVAGVFERDSDLRGEQAKKLETLRREDASAEVVLEIDQAGKRSLVQDGGAQDGAALRALDDGIGGKLGRASRIGEDQRLAGAGDVIEKSLWKKGVVLAGRRKGIVQELGERCVGCALDGLENQCAGFEEHKSAPLRAGTFDQRAHHAVDQLLHDDLAGDRLGGLHQREQIKRLVAEAGVEGGGGLRGRLAEQITESFGQVLHLGDRAPGLVAAERLLQISARCDAVACVEMGAD